ncbi:unnamed protein product [Soboliphyme baturini]|uniref:BON domain-containing protein n=1 Tax=Soboliphyme baturini TaxID=241478 RepID=A0A183IN70_9BILA|nr:unnamed protein product [Soboliphyme baturini]
MSVNEYLISDLNANVSRDTTIRVSGSTFLVRDGKKAAVKAAVKHYSCDEMSENMMTLVPGAKPRRT